MHHISRPVDDPEQTEEPNADKTQLIWLGIRQQLVMLTVMQLQLSASFVEFYSVVVHFLGVVLDNQLSVGPQVTAVSRSCFTMCQLRVI